MLPSLIESPGRVTAATSALAADVLSGVRPNDTGSQPVTPDCAGVGSDGGVSPLGFGSETNVMRFRALASRCVNGLRPKQFSIVAGIEA
jgi:hypothetical protein